jgi:CubicO group peptidase (beta-lactamase class C family)
MTCLAPSHARVAPFATGPISGDLRIGPVRILALAALLAVGAAPAFAQDPEAARHPGTDQERVDRIMADYTGSETPGVVVAVVRDGRVVFQRGYGMANLSHGVPFTPDTRTNIGSTSKQFTAFAIGLLEERGRLSLDDDVRTHLPEIPDLGETVTLRHLMTHTSGYREFLNALAVGGWRLDRGDHIERDEIFTVVQRQPALQNSPGAEYNYNNTGYALLAEVVARVTGESFPDWMRTNVFEPVGMTATMVRANPRQIVPNSAQGYVPAGEGVFYEVMDIGSSMGAGGVYTTVGDLALWMRNLGTGEVGGPALMERMTTRNVLTTGDTTSYAMGLMVMNSRGLRVIQHGGGDAAHRSTFVYYPQLDAGLIVQSNYGGFDNSLPGRIAEVFFGEHMTPLEGTVAAEPAVPAADPALAEVFDPEAYDPAQFDAYVGRYALDVQPQFVLTFWREEGRLLSRATGQPVVELRPTSDSTFTVVGIPANLTFHRGEAGAVTGLTLHQNGDHHATRLTDDEEPAVDLSPYRGRYYSAEFETVYTVVVEDDQLVLRHRRQQPITLRHSGGDAFAGTFPFARVEFERGDDGAVVAFRADAGRATGMLFERME